jgi:hypothetical protein
MSLIKRYGTFWLALATFCTIPLLIAGSQGLLVPNVPLDNEVIDMAKDSQGRLIVVGRFRPINIMRLTPNLTVDTAFHGKFQVGGADGKISSVAVDGDDNIFLAGDFSRFDDAAVKYLVKISNKGGVDYQFLNSLGTGFDGPIERIAIDRKDTIMVSGLFKTFNGEPVEGCALLDSVGNLLKGCTVSVSTIVEDGRGGGFFLGTQSGTKAAVSHSDDKSEGGTSYGH